MHTGRYDVAFEDIGKWQIGVWLARVTQTSDSRVDHYVLVSAFQKLKFDPAEAYTIRLSPNSLDFCGRASFPGVQVAEALHMLV